MQPRAGRQTPPPSRSDAARGARRVRAPSLIASAIDGLSVSGSVVAPAVCEALATLERRSPGRLENVHAQSPRAARPSRARSRAPTARSAE
jgi:hypothetical protein